jgi:hypothetical protein
LSDESATQLLDQLTGLAKNVSEIREELASVKLENERLRQQVAGLLGAAEPAAAEVPVAIEKPSQEEVDEEFLVDLVRASGVKEQEVAPRDAMSDDEVQRILAEAALGAVDASQPAAGSEPAPVLRLVEDSPAEEPSYQAVLDFDLDHALLAKVPANLAIAALAVPHRMEGSKLVCKVAQPYDYPSLAIIADAIACEVVPEPAMIEQVLAALRVAYSDESRETEKDALWSAGTEAPKRKRGLFRRSA